MLNKLLQRQIQKHFGEIDNLPGNCKALLKTISDSYDHYEKDRKMLERSIDISSNEMIELNNKLRTEITELEKAKRELKDNEANLNAIINNTNDSIFSIDRNYRILSLNNSFINQIHKLSGIIVKHGDYILFQEIGKKRINNWKNYFDRALAGEQFKVEIEEVMDRKITHAEISFNPIRENDNIIGVGCFSRNITNEKLNSERLQASEIRFRSLIENSQDMLCLLNSQGDIEYISPAVERAFGYSNHDNPYSNSLKDIHPDDLLLVKEKFRFVIENPVVPTPFTIRNKRKDGSYIQMEGVFSNLLHVKGVNSIVGNFRDITEKKYAEEKLKKSEANLQTIFNNTNTGYLLIDKDFKIILFNHPAQKFAHQRLQRSISEGENIVSYFHPEKQKFIKDILDSTLGGKVIDYEINYFQEDGCEKWYFAKYFPVLNDDGIIFGAIMSIEDFTERKMASQKIKQSNERYELATKATRDAIWDWNFITNELYWSEGYEKNFGYKNANKEKNIVTWIQGLHPEDRRRVIKGIHASIKDPNSDFWEDEYRYIKEDGSIAHIHDRGYIVYSDEGKPIRMVGAMQDITERKKVEEALQKNESQLREISSSIPGIVYQFKIDPKGNKSFPYISDGVQTLMGISPQEIYKNENITFDKTHPDDLDALVHSIAISSATLEPWLHIFRVMSPDGESYKWIRGNSIPRKTDDGSILWNGTMIDITERKIAELERDKMVTDIIQRNKNLEQFSYIVSHNLRAPVANIIGLSLALQEGKADGNLDEELIEGLCFSAKKLDDVITDLNDILQIKHGINERKEIVSFSGISNDIYLSIKNQVKASNASIRWDFSEIDKVSSLKSYLQSIFYNLIINSIKYRKHDVAPKINIKSYKRKNTIELLFKDNCMGIDLGINKDYIFGLYKRFHNHEIEGKGIGLFMVKTQVEAIGGKISIQSEVNKGTEFKIEFEI
jgi:PAS domain S-box-containing protein